MKTDSPSPRGPKPGPKFFLWYVWKDLLAPTGVWTSVVLLTAVTLSCLGGSLAVGWFEGEAAVRKKRLELEPLNLCLRLTGQLHEGETTQKLLQKNSWDSLGGWLERKGTAEGRPWRFDLFQIIDVYELVVPNALESAGKARFRCRTLRTGTDGKLDPWYKIRDWEPDLTRPGHDAINEWNGVILTRSFIDEHFGKGEDPRTVTIEFVPGNPRKDIPVLGILKKDLPDDVNVLIPEPFLDAKLGEDDGKKLQTVYSGPVPDAWPAPKDARLKDVFKSQKLVANEPLPELRPAGKFRYWIVRPMIGGDGFTRTEWVETLASLEAAVVNAIPEAKASERETFSRKLEVPGGQGESLSSARPRGNFYNAVAWFDNLQQLKAAADVIDRLRENADAGKAEIPENRDSNRILFNREVVDRVALLDEIVRNTRITMLLCGAVAGVALLVSLGAIFYQRLHAQRAELGMLRVMGIGWRVFWIGLLEGLVLGSLGILAGLLPAFVLGRLSGTWRYESDPSLSPSVAQSLARLSFQMPLWWWAAVATSVASLGGLLALVTWLECQKSPSMMMRDNS